MMSNKRQACDRCHIQKLRCSQSAAAAAGGGSGLCTRCLHQGVECVYSEPLPKGRPRRHDRSLSTQTGGDKAASSVSAHCPSADVAGSSTSSDSILDEDEHMNDDSGTKPKPTGMEDQLSGPTTSLLSRHTGTTSHSELPNVLVGFLNPEEAWWWDHDGNWWKQQLDIGLDPVHGPAPETAAFSCNHPTPPLSEPVSEQLHHLTSLTHSTGGSGPLESITTLSELATRLSHAWAQAQQQQHEPNSTDPQSMSHAVFDPVAALLGSAEAASPHPSAELLKPSPWRDNIVASQRLLNILSSHPHVVSMSDVPQQIPSSTAVVRHLVLACHSLLLSIFDVLLSALQHQAASCLLVASSGSNNAPGDTLMIEMRLVLLGQLSSYTVDSLQKGVQKYLASADPDYKIEPTSPGTTIELVQHRVNRLRELLLART